MCAVDFNRSLEDSQQYIYNTYEKAEVKSLRQEGSPMDCEHVDQ